ncbi:response regulator transcription factor [Actinoplanes sp. TBRC 11911]|uniref:response regulator n=1 Tax=Actinoplanes sp. TBRC 11911 TaxID=2729386 RepID=UPI00145FA45C|nr:response regulator transcription factor [Actinoplanes sp. TBRC 11911]NMO56596.1 response regulator transcription factor [Actinoplanes sp. TBRC 11911]
MIRVLIADDQQVVREGLALVLGLLPDVEVVGAAGDGNEAIEMAGRLEPDVVLMDLRMPRCDGIEATRRLRDLMPAVRVVVLTTYTDDKSLLEALRAGARGYLTKDAGGEEISQALRQVLDDRAMIDPRVQHHLVDALNAAPAAPDGLTTREAEVLSLMARGLSNAAIAEQLVITPHTVKTHITHVFAKLGVRDRAQAVAYAYQQGLT